MTASRHLPRRLSSEAANGAALYAHRGRRCSAGDCVRRWRAVEGGPYGVDGTVKQLSRLLCKIVDHAFALASRRRAGSGLADLGIHLLEFGTEVSSIGPAPDNLFDAD